MKLPKEEGFPILPIKTLPPERMLAIARKGRTNWYNYDLIKRLVGEELTMFDKIKPDIVLSDFRLSLHTSCELANIPLVAILNASWTNYSSVRIKAPEHHGLTKIFGKRLATVFAPLAKHLILIIDARPIKKFRHEKGLNPRKNIFDFWRGDFNLIVDIPEYGPTVNLPEQFQYIGPIVWEPEIESPDWVEKLDPKKPTIYFTMGSTGNPYFFEQAIEIFGNSDYQCVITTAGLIELVNIPKNFFVVAFAPGSKIMEKSDIVVCQGGNGTIYQALQNGVPIIGIPTMHDQEFNLDQVEKLGVGIKLSELKFKPKHLEKAVKQILSQERFKTNALKLKKVLSAYDAPRKGAELISSYCNSTRSQQ
jgi:MGT family glycosyltransferase